MRAQRRISDKTERMVTKKKREQRKNRGRNASNLQRGQDDMLLAEMSEKKEDEKEMGC
jgi:hypothetical protein